MRVISEMVRKSKQYVSCLLTRMHGATYSCAECFQSLGCTSLDHAIPVLVTHSGTCYTNSSLTGSDTDWHAVCESRRLFSSSMQNDLLMQQVNQFSSFSN